MNMALAMAIHRAMGLEHNPFLKTNRIGPMKPNGGKPTFKMNRRQQLKLNKRRKAR